MLSRGHRTVRVGWATGWPGVALVWVPMSITLQVVSLVEKVVPIQVRFAIHLRDQRMMWMQYACKVHMDTFMVLNGSCFMVTWTIFKNCLLKVGLTQKLGDHFTPNVHNRWFILFYHVWGPTLIKIHWNSIWLRAWSHMASHYTWRVVTTLHDFGGVMGQPLDTFFWALAISCSRLLIRVWSGP
jgi:hypothetical protein